MLSLIVCMDKNRGIGKNNSMPWHLPKEMKYFKETTTGHIVVMGRNTYESIGKPLENRTNMVISSTLDFNTKGIVVAENFNDALYASNYMENEEVFVIGGANVYEQFMPYADRLYITKIDANFDCDTFFPSVGNWIDWNYEDSKSWIDEDNGYTLKYLVIDRHKKE